MRWGRVYRAGLSRARISDPRIPEPPLIASVCFSPEKATSFQLSLSLSLSLLALSGDSGTVVEKSFSNQKVASSIPCRSVLEQDTEPLIAPDVPSV